MSKAAAKKTKPAVRKANVPKNAPISGEVKATIIAHLLAGDSASKIAEELGLAKSTVYKVKGTIREQLAELEAERREEIADNLFMTVIATQEALQAQLKVMKNEAYLLKQPAESLAVLYGVVFDKGVRLLESLVPVEEDSPSNPVSEDQPA